MDDRFRRLERLAAQGDPQASAELLLLRYRRGELPKQTLELLAYLGHPPAREAMSAEELTPADVPDLRMWVYGMAKWEELYPHWAATVAAWKVLPLFEERFADDPRPRQALEVAGECWQSADLGFWGHDAHYAALDLDHSLQKATSGPAHWAALAAQKAAESWWEVINPAKDAMAPTLMVGAALDAAVRATEAGRPGEAPEAFIRGVIREELVRIGFYWRPPD